MPEASSRRFLTLDDVAEELATSTNQIYALVRQGKLEGVKIGGRGQWRVERDKLEKYIQRLYDETRAFIRDNPYDQTTEQDNQAQPADSGVEPGHEDVTALAAMANPLPPSAALGAGGSPGAINPGDDAQRNGAEPEL
jgi:excisionase family DNA binding protein